MFITVVEVSQQAAALAGNVDLTDIYDNQSLPGFVNS